MSFIAIYSLSQRIELNLYLIAIEIDMFDNKNQASDGQTGMVLSLIAFW